MFCGSPCQLRAAFYIRTIGCKIVFRVIFFPPHLTDTTVSRVIFVSATFHHFLVFVSVSFHLFLCFPGCAMCFWCLLRSTILCSSTVFSVSATSLIFDHFSAFFCVFRGFCVSYETPCFGRFPSFCVIFVTTIFYSFVSASCPVFVLFLPALSTAARYGPRGMHHFRVALLPPFRAAVFSCPCAPSACYGSGRLFSPLWSLSLYGR